jgi:hypothetical protein
MMGSAWTISTAASGGKGEFLLKNAQKFRPLSSREKILA